MTDWSYPTYNYPCKDLEAKAFYSPTDAQENCFKKEYENLH